MTDIVAKSITESLQEASDSLTEANWHKGSYFTEKEGVLCMCAHGAVQALVNPDVVAALTPSPARSPRPGELAEAEAPAARAATATAAMATAAAATGATAAFVGAARVTVAVEFQTAALYKKRPSWVSGSSRGLNAHYIMGMVGLTVGYNDAADTNLVKVKAKFSDAISIAKELGV